jgi:hypothetical protein
MLASRSSSLLSAIRAKIKQDVFPRGLVQIVPAQRLSCHGTATKTCISIKKAPAEVIGEAIAEIYNIVFNSHDLTMSGTAVRWSSETPAHHLHVQYGAEDRP